MNWDTSSIFSNRLNFVFDDPHNDLGGWFLGVWISLGTKKLRRLFLKPSFDFPLRAPNCASIDCWGQDTKFPTINKTNFIPLFRRPNFLKLHILRPTLQKDFCRKVLWITFYRSSQTLNLTFQTASGQMYPICRANEIWSAVSKEASIHWKVFSVRKLNNPGGNWLFPRVDQRKSKSIAQVAVSRFLFSKVDRSFTTRSRGWKFSPTGQPPVRSNGAWGTLDITHRCLCHQKSEKQLLSPHRYCRAIPVRGLESPKFSARKVAM